MTAWPSGSMRADRNIVTRPLGAWIGDLLSPDRDVGGVMGELVEAT